MLYFPENMPEPYRSHVARGRLERARVISTVLTAAAKGVWSGARWTARALAWSGRTVISGVVRAHRRRTAIRQLYALDNRLLKDIGISRDQIPAVVDGMTRQRRGAETPPAESCEIAKFPRPRKSPPRRRIWRRRAA